MWQWNVDTDGLAMDLPGYELCDVPPTDDLSFALLSEKVYPADRNRVREALSATRSVSGSYEIDFRTLIGAEVRWISARGQGSDVGIIRRAMTGIFIDITDRKQAEEGHELLAVQMRHCVKNLLAIAGALNKITMQSSSSIEDTFGEALKI